MKRKVFLTAVILMLSMFSGCGGEESGGGSVSVPESAQANTDGVKELKLTAIYIEPWLTSLINDFNKNNSEYRVIPTSLVGESTDFKEKTGWKDAYNKFNIEVLSGNTPDIIFSGQTDMMNIYRYVNKGIMAELNELMDNDLGFKKEDYLPSVLSAMENNGKIYELFPFFMLDTVTGKTSDVGTEPGWTLDEFAAFIDSKPDAEYIFDFMSKDEFICKMVCIMFVNPLTMEVNFDRTEFEKILKISDRFPTGEMSERAWTDSDRFFAGAIDGDPILLSNLAIFGGWGSVRHMDIVRFGGEGFTYKGYPTKDGGNGTYFLPFKFSAVKNSNTGGSWEFIKYLLNFEKYEDTISGIIPVKLSMVNKRAEQAKEKDHWFNAVYENGTTIDIGVNTDEDNQRIIDLINSTNSIYPYDDVIYNIVSEEAGAYASGQKTASEVADIVENRINLYIEEVF